MASILWPRPGFSQFSASQPQPIFFYINTETPNKKMKKFYVYMNRSNLEGCQKIVKIGYSLLVI